MARTDLPITRDIFCKKQDVKTASSKVPVPLLCRRHNAGLGLLCKTSFGLWYIWVGDTCGRVSKLIKWLLKSLGQIQCAKKLLCLYWHHGLLDILTWGAINLQFIHLSLQPKWIHPTQSKVLWTKERHDTWLQTSKHYCYASSTQNLIKNSLHEIMVISQG